MNEEEKIFKKRWQLASPQEKTRYDQLLASQPKIEWTFKEKRYLLWLCQFDIETFENVEAIIKKAISIDPIK